MKQEQFTVDYFIKKFEAIPESLMISAAQLDHKKQSQVTCALGHCGGYTYYSEESKALAGLFSVLYPGVEGLHCCFVYDINDGCNGNYKQPTPKQRILAALYDIKKMQQPIEQDEVKETIRYVTVEVDKEVKQLTKQPILN